MALRDQPYLPLYVQDFLTDERLNECSAESTGVYIRIMCIMHKSDPYGTIHLGDKYKQNPSKDGSKSDSKDGSKPPSTISGFARKLLRQMPYELAVIEHALLELLDEGVLQIDGDFLVQKRMVRDGNLSLIRAESGRKGGEAKKKAAVATGFATGFASNFATAKSVASTESEIEYESENENDILKEGVQREKVKAARHKHGEYNNVLLTDTDMEKLQSEYPNDWQERIERLSAYMASTGKAYKNHLATIRNWARKETAKTPMPINPRKSHNYEEREVDFDDVESRSLAAFVVEAQKYMTP